MVRNEMKLSNFLSLRFWLHIVVLSFLTILLFFIYDRLWSIVSLWFGLASIGIGLIFAGILFVFALAMHKGEESVSELIATLSLVSGISLLVTVYIAGIPSFATDFSLGGGTLALALVYLVDSMLDKVYPF